MNHSAITDIYGNSIVSNNNAPFILLHIENPDIILEEINTFICDQHGSFWKFISKNISYVLNKFGLNSSKFAPLGHMWFPVKHLRGRVVLLLANMNKSISSYPVDFVKLCQYGKGYIWKPVPPKGYEGLGYMYSLYKPSTKQMRVISNKYVIKQNISNKSFQKNTIMNEYNYLGQIGYPSFTLRKNNTLCTKPHKLICSQNKSPSKSKYNWDDYDNKSTITEDSADSWVTPKGKFVVLMEPDEPWFIKKKNEEKKRTPIKMQRRLGKIIGIDTKIKPQQKVKSLVSLDETRPDLGYGYSYKSRLNNIGDNDEVLYENFEGPDSNQSFFSKTINIIMMCLFITIITLLICRLYIELKQ